MRPQDVLHIMQSTAPAATIEDAEAFLGLCEQRGLTPFMEASPLVMDYTKQNGEHVHTIGIKEHYAVAERWAQQSGGYTIRVRDVHKEKNGDIVARIGIVSNRDYAAVGKMCAMIPGIDFKEELAGFVVYGDAIIEAKEMQRRSPPKSKTWEWIAEKRARESAITQKFGKEPSQSRQLYTNAVAAISLEDATAALFPAPQKRDALPAPEVVEGEYTEGVNLNGKIVHSQEAYAAEFDPETDKAALDAFVESEAVRYATATQATETGDDAPADLPTGWYGLQQYAVDRLGLQNNEIVNALRKHCGGGKKDWNPWTLDGGKCNGDPAEFWTALKRHAAEKA